VSNFGLGQIRCDNIASDLHPRSLPQAQMSNRSTLILTARVLEKPSFHIATVLLTDKSAWAT